MAGETYVGARKLIKESRLFSSGKPFTIKELAAQTGIAHDFLSQVLSEMKESGRVSKTRVAKKRSIGGIEWHYRKQILKPREFLAMKLRRHTNEQLGLEPMHAWAVI